MCPKAETATGKMRPKNPQPPEDQTDVVAGTAQNGMQRIAHFAFQVVASQ